MAQTPSPSFLSTDSICRAYLQTEQMNQATFEVGLAYLRLTTTGLSTIFGAASIIPGVLLAQGVGAVADSVFLADQIGQKVPRLSLP